MANATVNPKTNLTVYSAVGRKLTLIFIVGASILTPVIFEPYLEPIMTLFPIVALIGIGLVRTGRPHAIPTWIVFNMFSAFFMVYAAYAFGTTFSVQILIGFLLFMIVYDVVGVKGGQMQSMAGRMIRWGVPLFVMVPQSRTFSFDEFRAIVSEEGLEGLHGSDHGVSMLGIGDGFLPGALAVAASSVGTAYGFGLLQLTFPQVGAAIGGIIGLSILMWAELPRAIAALIVSVPGALIGFAAGYGLDFLLYAL